MNNATLSADQIAEMNDSSRFAREEAARAATRREMAKIVARRRIRMFVGAGPDRVEVFLSHEAGA